MSSFKQDWQGKTENEKNQLSQLIVRELAEYQIRILQEKEISTAAAARRGSAGSNDQTRSNSPIKSPPIIPSSNNSLSVNMKPSKLSLDQQTTTTTTTTSPSKSSKKNTKDNLDNSLSSSSGGTMRDKKRSKHRSDKSSKDESRSGNTNNSKDKDRNIIEKEKDSKKR